MGLLDGFFFHQNIHVVTSRDYVLLDVVPVYCFCYILYPPAVSI
jgi:hypothetical protein